jgi:hypothetical protein
MSTFTHVTSAVSLLLLASLPAPSLGQAGGGCVMQNNCNGHGICQTSTKTCACFEGWGADSDVSLFKAADCSRRVCPHDRAWVDVPTGEYTAHAEAECSYKGICDTTTGICNCFAGFTGNACQRKTCPNDCSGHGRCVSMREMATMTTALPLSAATTYDGYEDTITWDQDKIYGCVCDSSWAVGLGDAETQTPEYFGPDCSLRHCPSGDDPNTSADETDCNGVDAAGGQGTGTSGNLCHVDCSNRGICDHSTGLCDCFTGYWGESCDSKSVLAT